MIEKKTLPNGARMVWETMPDVRSAAVGFWVGRGSRHEPDELSGISHVIEHMVFKGTAGRTAAQIAAEMDAIGGQVNAFTTKESTCFYARSLDIHLPVAIDLIGDIFFEPRIDQEDWENERGVILEEIDMYEDSPEDLVSERLFAKVFEGMSLGRPILGTKKTLMAMDTERIKRYKNENYRPCDIVVSLAGRFTQQDMGLIEERLLSLRDDPRPGLVECSYTPGFTVQEKPIEQNHLCIGFPGLPLGHEDRHVMSVMSGILGAGMSSRLFQTVREKNGLCYSIYSFTAQHAGVGLFGVYTALGKNTEKQALRLTREVIEEFSREGPEPHELERAREQIKANVLMGLESTNSRMNHLGQSELLVGRTPEPDEIIRRLDAVTAERVTDLARRILDFDSVSFSAVGQVDSESAYREVIGAGRAAAV